MGIRSLIKGGLKFGIGAARFAGQELRERLGKKQEPNANMPHNPEPPEQAGLEHQLEEEAMRPVAALDVKDLKVELDSANPPLLLDCRELHEWEAGYIRGCLHVPMNSIPERLAELDPSRRTIVYCLHGIRSAQVASTHSGRPAPSGHASRRCHLRNGDPYRDAARGVRTNHRAI